MTLPRRAWALAAGLGLVVTLLLARGHREVGYVRDEGIYFAASRAYAEWAALLVHDPRAALDPAARDRAFAINREHPALMKLAGGISARLLSAPGPEGQPGSAPGGALPLVPEGAAMRLPAQALAGLGAALLFLAGWSLARRHASQDMPSGSGPEGQALLCALLAALWFIGLPHVWFHAGLHCFDVPVAVLTLAVVLCYRRALASPRWGLALGPLLGVAISVKHNALFIPVLLALHYAACLLLARRRPTRGQWLPLPFVGMALLAPPTVLALWPWLWSAPLARLQEYVEFHRLHAYYNTEYLGVNYNQPPLPWGVPWLSTWATVPSALLLLALVGLVLGVRRDLSRRPDPTPGSFTAPLAGEDRRDGLLLALFSVFPLALISLPSVPIFGGTKHWLTAYPFLALAAAHGWLSLWTAAAPAGRARRLAPAALALVLLPGLWSTVHGHPYGLSQYAPLAGGARGAAQLGLLRGFWGSAALPLVRDLGASGAELPVYLHDMHELARQQYAREGRWPPGLTSVPPGRARAGLIFHERHMLTYEVELWNRLGTTIPAEVLALDDVPLTSLYAPGYNQGR